jgi:hypothetical protein
MPKVSALVYSRRLLRLLHVQTVSALGSRHLALTLLLVVAGSVAACAPDPERQRLERTTKATYDPQTGRLQRLTYDANKNGRIDTWTFMDGTKILRSEIDRDEDGKIDRWEYHGADGTLEKVGFSRANDGRADAWAYSGADGKVARVEISAKQDGTIDRREFYEQDALVRAEEDTNADGRSDKWETYAAGRVSTVSFDETGDGRPDRRLTYGPTGALVSIESEPDTQGRFTKRVAPR